MGLPIKYEDLINKPSSHKVILCWVEPIERAVIWQHVGSNIYKRSTVKNDTTFYVIDVILDKTSLVEGNSEALNQGEFYFKAESGEVFVRLADDSNPKDSFITIKYRLFYSDGPFISTHDLTDTGNEVEYEGLIQDDPNFKKEIDPATQLGIALESNSTLTLENTHGFFDSIFDKLFWIEKRVVIYSWFPELPISEKKKLFEGVISDKDFSPKDVKFKIKDQIFKIRKDVTLGSFSNSDGKISEDVLGKPKRRLYGLVKGVRTQSIEQTLEGFTLTGTLSGTQDSLIVNGVGTQFLTELSPNDIITVPLTEEVLELNVDKIISDTQFTLSFELESSFINKVCTNSPDIPTTISNRRQFLAGHKLREPITTVTEVLSQNRLRLASVQDLFPLDIVLIEGVPRFIKRITNDVIVLTQSLANPEVGNSVTRSPIKRAYFNKKELIINRDFTLINNATEAIIELNNLAEFNQTKARSVLGTSVTFTNGSRVVTGIDTEFLDDFKPRDWIVSGDINHQTFYEILQVNSNTQLELRVNYNGVNFTGSARKKNVTYIDDDSVVLVDCFGKEDATGKWVKTASDVVKDLITNDAALTEIDLDSFVQSSFDAPYIMSLKLPVSFDGFTPKIRDIINIVNKSVFGSLISKSDFSIAYNVLNVEKPNDVLEIKNDDLVADPVYRGDSKIYKNINGNFNHFDGDVFTLESGSTPIEYSSEFVDKLLGTDDSLAVDVYLSEENAAETIVQRYALFYSQVQSNISLSAKLNLTLKNIGDKLLLNLDRMFFRFGAASSRLKMGVITKISKSGTNTDVIVSDLSNIFSRVGTIADDSSDDFTNATDSQKILNGYIVDDNTELPDNAANSDDEWGDNRIG